MAYPYCIDIWKKKNNRAKTTTTKYLPIGETVTLSPSFRKTLKK